MADPDIGYLTRSPGYRSKDEPKTKYPTRQGPVRVGTTTYGQPLKPYREKQLWNGHVLPKDNSDDSIFVGVDENAMFARAGSTYLEPMMKPTGNPGDVEYQATGVFKYNTWTYLEKMRNWGPDRLKPVQEALLRGGWITKQAVKGSWNDSTEKAVKALMLIGNRSGMAWMSALDNGTDITGNQPSGTGSGPPENYTSTQTSYSKIPRRDALTALKDAMTEDLGRAPTDEEMRGFIKELRGFEKENPSITTTKHRFKKVGDEYVDEPTSYSEPAADPSFMFDEFAEENPETKKDVKRYRRANLLWNLVDDIESGAM